MRIVSVQARCAVDGFIRRCLLIHRPVFLPVFVVGCIAPESELPFRIGGVVHRVVDGIEDRNEPPVVARVHANHIEQRYVHLPAVNVEALPGQLILLRGFPGRVTVEMIAVDQRRRRVRHVIRRRRVFLLERVCKEDCADRLYHHGERRLGKQNRANNRKCNAGTAFLFHRQSSFLSSQYSAIQSEIFFPIIIL